MHWNGREDRGTESPAVTARAYTDLGVAMRRSGRWLGGGLPSPRLLLWMGALAPLLASSVAPASPEWLNYTNGDLVNSFDEDATSIWMATNGGLVRLDKRTGERSFFNRANSGLTSNILACVHIQGNGVVWVAMRGTPQLGKGAGLARYDGTTWDIYTDSNSGLPSNSVGSIASDVNGNVWIGSGRDLVRFDGTNWSVYGPADYGITAGFVGSVVVDGNDVWFSVPAVVSHSRTLPGALVRFDGTTWQLFTEANSAMPSSAIQGLALEEPGVIWIGAYGYWNLNDGQFHSGGLSQLADSTWATYEVEMGQFPTDAIRSVAIDSSGVVWVGTNMGVVEFFEGSWTVHDTSNSGLPSDEVLAIHTTTGGVWAGAWLAGAVSFDGTTWTPHNVSNSPMPYHSPVQAFELGPEGSLWIALEDQGQEGGGLLQRAQGSWTYYCKENSGLPSDRVRDVAADASGAIWLAIMGIGIARFDGSDWIEYNVFNSGLPNHSVDAVAVDGQGNVWIGTVDGTTGGLTRFDGNDWTVYDTSNSGIASSVVQDIVIDQHGIVWAGTSAGLSRFDGSTWMTVLDNQGVYALHIDAAGNLWAGADGLSMFDGNTWTTYDTSNSGIPTDYVMSIGSGSNGDVWIGTALFGAVRFDGATWQVFDLTNSGITNDYTVQAITVDHLGNTWMGCTMDGISVYQEGGVATDVSSIASEGLPRGMRLYPCSPNPFNPSTRVKYELASLTTVSLAVFDVKGRLVQRLAEGTQAAGSYSVQWNGRDGVGRLVPSGVYFTQLNSGANRRAVSMVLVR